MGNLPSAPIEGEEMYENELEKEGQIQGIVNVDPDSSVTDYSLLFNTEALLKALVDVKDSEENLLQQKSSDINQWLKTLTKRGETTVSEIEFIDSVTNKGVPKEEAQKFFSELDPDQQGCVDITFMLQILKDSRGPTMGDTLLMPCPYLPGVLDTYLINRPSSQSDDLGLEIVKFIRRYRVDPLHLAPRTISQLVGLFRSREQMINGQYHLVKEKQKEGIEEELDDNVKVMVSKCYSKIKCSSSENTVSKLTDGNLDTYWQSNGSPRCHWIRLQMSPGVRLKELTISVNSADDSYMPKTVSVSVGNTPSGLKEIKSVSIPREHNHRFVLVGPLSSEYKYIQINIRQCHSDGCDTRVRQLYIKGYKQKKEEDQPTVLDGLVMWYLGLISSVSKAAMPIAPTLRDTLLTQSKYALQYLPPLSLSRTSPSKPEFVTPVVLKEMEAFFKSLCLPPDDNYVSLDSESLSVLIEFSLSIGNINTILDCLLNLLDNISLSLPVGVLMKKLSAIEEKKYSYHARSLSLNVFKCDTKAEEGSSVENIFTSSSTTPFKSQKDVKVINVIVTDDKKNLFQTVKLNIKVPSENGPRAVLVFGFEDMDVDSEDLFDKFNKYDSWTQEDWEDMMKKVENKELDQFEDGLLTYLEHDKDSKEFEISFPSSRAVKYILFKFIAQEAAERISVQSIILKGYKATPQGIEIINIFNEMTGVYEVLRSPPSLIEYDGGHVLVRLLVFLCKMLQDINCIQSHKGISITSLLETTESIQESHVCVENFSLEKVWSLYVPLTFSSDEDLQNHCSLLCLILLRNGIQFLKSPSSVSETRDSSLSMTEGVSDSSIASDVLSHLCSLVDNTDSKPIVQTLAREIIKEGVVVFFPGTKARKKYLLEMVNTILTGEQPSSWWLKFEALCSYFSQKDNNSLLELNWNIDKIINIVPDDIMNILATVITVATQQVMADLNAKASQRQDDLVKLLCSMQSSLLFWCKYLLTHTDDADKDNEMLLKGAKDVLSQHVECINQSCYTVLNKVHNANDIVDALTLIEKSIVGQTLPQLISFLSSFSTMNHLPYITLLNTLQPLSSIINNICVAVPSITPKLGSDVLKCQGDDEIVAVWTRESKHNYDDNSNITEEFVCPAASKFVVEFDTRCHTERRYDYLTFNDACGTKVQFDDNYSSDRWPTKGEFKGPKLSFHFHSDGSNNFWGYKFTIKAYGKSIPPLHWVYDLNVSLSRLFGQYVSSIISGKADISRHVSKQEEKKEEEILLKSDIWTTLFRGGLTVGKLTRSLSGAYEAISTKETALCSMLFEMGDGDESPPLIEVCRSAKPLPSYGGPMVDKVIGAVFAALIWHSQEIREELNNMMGSSPKPTPNILDAFTAAEALRRELVESRQKVVEAKEKEEDEGVKSLMNEDEPLNSCHNKAMFLLKFAGLTRVSYDSNRPSSPVTSRPSWGQKSWRLQKSQSVVSTVGRIKQQISRETKPLSPAEKHPSFETVLSFVRNNGLTVANVETLLQERAGLARRMADGFGFAAEYLRIMSAHSSPEIPLLTFLQHLLVNQRNFPRHYAMRVDGCGLELETRLRRSFQMFIQRLIDIIKTNQCGSTRDNIDNGGLGMIKNVFSHLMDISWQDYDLTLLRELQLPDYLFESIIGSSVTERQVVIDTFDNEEVMLKNYKLHMRFMEEWSEVSRFTDFLSSDIAQEDFRQANLFVVAMAFNPSKNNRTSVNCDSCRTIIENPWYRDVDIDDDCDLCQSCFKSGSGNRPTTFSKEHVLLHVGHHLCKGCGMSIITHRFQRQSDKNNYCIGCFRKETSDSQWTVYLLSECPATDNSNKFMSSSEEHSKGMDYCNGVLTELKQVSEGVLYNRQHNWMLFSSLTLMMAKKLNQKEKTDPQYLRPVCEILSTCLQLIVQGLKFALSAAKDSNALRMREMELLKKKEMEAEKLKEEENKKQEEEERRIETDKEEQTDNGPPPPQSLEEPVVSPPEEETMDNGNIIPDIQDSSVLEEQDINVPKEQDSTVPKEQDSTVLKVKDAGVPEEQDSGSVPEVQDTGVLEEQDSSVPEVQGSSVSEVQDTGVPEVQNSSVPKEQDSTIPEVPDTGVTELQDNGVPDEQDSGVPDSIIEETDFAERINVQSSVRQLSSLQKQVAISDSITVSEIKSSDGVSSSEKAFGLMFYESMLGLLASVLPKELSLLPWISISGTVEKVVGDSILPQLFRIARSKEMNTTHRLQAITVAIKYMSRVSPEVADHAIEVLDGVVNEETVERKKTNGQKTVDYLFQMGANNLKDSDIFNAANITDCLLLLSKNPEWKPTLTTRISDYIGTTLNNSTSSSTDLSVVFGLLVLAGFPKLAKVGSCVKWTKGTTNDENHGVIVTTVTDSQANIININTRQSHSLKLSDIRVENSMEGCITETKLPEIIEIIKRGLPQANTDNQVEQKWILSLALKALCVLLGTSVKKLLVIESVLCEDLLPLIVKLACRPTHFSKLWKVSDLEILGISCYKPLEEKLAAENNGDDCKEDENKEEVELKNKTESQSETQPETQTQPQTETVVDVQHVSGFESDSESDIWADAETGASPGSGSALDFKTNSTEDKLVIDSVTLDVHVVSKKQTVDGEEQPAENTRETNEQFVSPPKDNSTPLKNEKEIEEEAVLRDLADDVQEMLKIMKDAFQCSLANVRAMYETAEQDMDKFIMSSDKFYDSETSGLKLPDDILEASKKWMPLQHSTSIANTFEEYHDDQEDTGVTGFLTIAVDLKKTEARAENQSELKKSLELLPSSKETKKKQKELNERERSHQLLQEQLNELKTTPADRELMLKVHHAQVILNAREVLTLLLIHWPLEAPKINSTLLGGLEMSHWFSLLDFLVKDLTQDERNNVLKKVVACSEADELITLGLTAAQCMKEVTVDIETKEFKYQTTEQETYTGKIVMSNAACMKVTMEKRHSLCGSVDIAANEEMSEHHWSGTGTGEKKKEDQEWNIPGNVVHYKVVLDKSDQKKVWSMRVSGLQKGRFETSYSLLHILLGSSKTTPAVETPPSILPIIKLWPNLIAAACELTGDQRIKVIGILLQLLLANSSTQKQEGSVEMGGASATGTGSVQRIDLAMLKPLWSLYTTMSKDYDKGDKSFQLKPEILRALTELFLVVENIALDWRMEQDLLVETITEDSLSQLLEKGISNVAYVSLALGLSNQVSDAFIEAKKNYVPNSALSIESEHLSSVDSNNSSSTSSSSTSSSYESEPTDSFEDSDMY